MVNEIMISMRKREGELKMAMLKVANQVRRKKANDNKWLLYGLIDKNSGLTIYELSKRTKLSAGKIKYYVEKLVKEEMINNSTQIVNGRTQKKYYGKSMKEFINLDEKDQD